MDNTREKLIELLQSCPTDIMGNCGVGALADHLIANGVTVQKHGYWVIKNIKNSKYRYCFCSECQTQGSPRWKCCPVCETKMHQPPKED